MLISFLFFLFVYFCPFGCNAPGFPESHDTYNGIGVERATGDVYYVLCAEEPNVAGRLYRYAVETSSVHLVGVRLWIYMMYI